jgi:hypothetical protein
LFYTRRRGALGADGRVLRHDKSVLSNRQRLQTDGTIRCFSMTLCSSPPQAVTMRAIEDGECSPSSFGESATTPVNAAQIIHPISQQSEKRGRMEEAGSQHGRDISEAGHSISEYPHRLPGFV